MGKIIGIDLGTTNSCVSVLESGSPRSLKTQRAADNAIHRRLHRRQRNFGGPVGQAASRCQSNQHLVRGEAAHRSSLEDDVVQKDIKMVPYQIVKAESGDAWVQVNDDKMAPPQVSTKSCAK